MNSRVNWVGNMRFLGTSGSNHAVVMDTSSLGGENSAATPMELILMGLAGCSGMDVVSILQKKRVDFTSLEIRVEGKRSEDHPKIFTALELDFVFKGKELKEKALEDAVRLSVEKYCSVAGMLKSTATLDWKVSIED